MNQKPDRPSPVPTRDTSFLRRVSPTTILWTGLLLGFMGLAAMLTAVILVAVLASPIETSASQRAGTELRPIVITTVGAHDSPEGRFTVTIVEDAAGDLRYAILTKATRERLGEGVIPVEPGETPWVFCWDADSNLWIWSRSGVATVHRLRTRIDYVRLDDWPNDEEARQSVPPEMLGAIPREPADVPE